MVSTGMRFCADIMQTNTELQGEGGVNLYRHHFNTPLSLCDLSGDGVHIFIGRNLNHVLAREQYFF